MGRQNRQEEESRLQENEGEREGHARVQPVRHLPANRQRKQEVGLTEFKKFKKPQDKM